VKESFTIKGGKANVIRKCFEIGNRKQEAKGTVKKVQRRHSKAKGLRTLQLLQAALLQG
jgi:hypothetical protein